VVPKDVERVRIDPSVKVIKDRAFQYCKKLKYVQFREGLEVIGLHAFLGCISLVSVRLPSTTKIIRRGAFYVIMNEGLQDIGDCVFSGCRMTKFVCLPSTMRRLRKFAFDDYGDLRKVALNEGLAIISEEASSDCDNLETIVISSEENHIQYILLRHSFQAQTRNYQEPRILGCHSLQR